MKVLLVGEYYSSNLGDPVLCQTVEHSILDAFPESEIIPFDISGKTGFDSYYKPRHYSCLQKWYFRLEYRLPGVLGRFPLCRVIRQDSERYMRTTCMLDDVLKRNTFDLVVFAGGSIFMDYFSGVIYGIVVRFAKRNTPIVFHACGMSRLTKDTAYVLQKALNYKNVMSISLRDSYSRFIEQFHVSANVTETYDTALICNKYYSKNKSIIADVGIGIINIPAYYDFQKAFVRSIRESGNSWKLFTNGSPSDRKIALQILHDLGITEAEQEKYIVDNPQNAEELITIVTGFCRIVAFRMHSQIVAMSYGIPSFGFVWDEKVRTLYNKMGMPKNCIDPGDQIMWEEIEDKLCIKSEQLLNLAQRSGESSQDSLIKQIKNVMLRKQHDS